MKDVDVALDLIAGEYGPRTLQVLRAGGVLITIDRTNAALGRLASERGRRVERFAVEPDQVGLERLAALVEDGALRVHVSETLPLEEAARAHALLAEGGRAGKIVLTV